MNWGRTLRYGVIGTGMMGVEHIRDILALGTNDAGEPLGEIAALCDTDEGSLATAREVVAGEGGSGGSGNSSEPSCYGDHRELLAAGECDAVVVATPNMTHVDILLDVIAAGVPVLVEKPLCTTVADCRRVIAAAQAAASKKGIAAAQAAASKKGIAAAQASAKSASTGPFVWVGLEYRYMPAIAQLIERAQAGEIGTVRMVALREHRFPFLPKVDDWNRFNANTGGTMVEKCCHFFDLMNFITQAQPVRVLASGAQDVNHLTERYEGRSEGEVPDILDNAYVLVEYDSGARAMLDLCMFAEATRNQEEVSVVGDLGKLEALVPEGVVRVGLRGTHSIGNVEEVAAHNPQIRYEGHHHGASFVEHLRFREALLSGSPPESDLEAGLLSVAIGVAAQISIAERRSVEMEEVLARA